MTVVASTPNKKRGADALSSPSPPLKKPGFFESLFGRASKEFADLCSSISSILYDTKTQQSVLTPKSTECSEIRGKQRKERSFKNSRKFVTPVTTQRQKRSRSQRPSQQKLKRSTSDLNTLQEIQDRYLTELLAEDATNSSRELSPCSFTPRYSPKYSTEPVVVIPVKSDHYFNSRKRRRVGEHSSTPGSNEITALANNNISPETTGHVHIYSTPFTLESPSDGHESHSPSLEIELSPCSLSPNEVSPISFDRVKRRKSNSIDNSSTSISPSKTGKIARLEEELQSLKAQVASLRQVMSEKKQHSSGPSSSSSTPRVEGILIPPPPPPPPLPLMQVGFKSLEIPTKTSDEPLEQVKDDSTKDNDNRMMLILEEMRTVKLRKTGRL